MIPIPPKYKFNQKLVVVNPNSFHFGTRGIAVDHDAGIYVILVALAVKTDTSTYIEIPESDLEPAEDN